MRSKSQKRLQSIEFPLEIMGEEEISETFYGVVAKLPEMMYTSIQLLMAHQQEVLQW